MLGILRPAIVIVSILFAIQAAYFLFLAPSDAPHGARETSNRLVKKRQANRQTQEKFRKWKAKTSGLTGRALVHQLTPIIPSRISSIHIHNANAVAVPWKKPTPVAPEIIDNMETKQKKYPKLHRQDDYPITWMQVQLAAYLIKKHGYQCDKVVSGHVWETIEIQIAGHGATIRCDPGGLYEIQDRPEPDPRFDIVIPLFLDKPLN